MAEWYANERFWSVLYPYLFSEERMLQGAVHAQQIAALSGVAWGRVLDLCCGPGRVALPLAAKGFQVTGVDASPFLLDKAKARAAEQGLSAEWVLEDMRSFCKPGVFDLAVNLFTSFGYFKDPEDDLRVLRNVHASLAPGGVLIMELMCKERLARIHEPLMVESLAGGALLAQQVEITDGWKWVRARWTLVASGRAEAFDLEHRLYSGQELEDRLLQTGFRDVALYGDLAGGDFGPKAERLVIAARKPEEGLEA